MDAKQQRRPVAILRQFLKSHDVAAVDSAAERAGTTRAYLIQIAGGHRLASAELAKALEEQIPGLLRAHLRPDLYGDLQPEALAGTGS